MEVAVSDHQLKDLMEQLGDAVHETLSGSNRISGKRSIWGNTQLSLKVTGDPGDAALAAS